MSAIFIASILDDLLVNCCSLEHMTLGGGGKMAEGKDLDESGVNDSAGAPAQATVNGHLSDEDDAAGSSDFTTSILGHPSNILIITNVADATFVSTEAKV